MDIKVKDISIVKVKYIKIIKNNPNVNNSAEKGIGKQKTESFRGRVKLGEQDVNVPAKSQVKDNRLRRPLGRVAFVQKYKISIV